LAKTQQNAQPLRNAAEILLRWLQSRHLDR
jgi:hypothetical protein